MLTTTGLVAEGGGMRGAYTAGVLEAFLNYNITFPYAIGVSAGANTLCSYLSHQKLRNKRLYTKWITDKRFISVRNFLTEGSYFGMNFLFNELPEALDPFDFEAFRASHTTFKVGVTNCKTGRCEYLEPIKSRSLQESDRILQASSSLPFIAKIVTINETPYLDGGLSDAIPIKKAIADGYERNVVILTRNADYRKTYSKKTQFITRQGYKQYPHLVHTVGARYQCYNETLDFIEALEKEGKVFVLRPIKPLTVDRYEKDSKKLNALYEQGYEQVMQNLAPLKSFIAN